LIGGAIGSSIGRHWFAAAAGIVLSGTVIGSIAGGIGAAIGANPNLALAFVLPGVGALIGMVPAYSLATRSTASSAVFDLGGSSNHAFGA
jgi:hypothetical protein